MDKIERILALSEASNHLLKKDVPLYIHILEKMVLPAALVILAYATYSSSNQNMAAQIALQEKQHDTDIELSDRQHRNNIDIGYLSLFSEKFLNGSKQEQAKILGLVDEIRPELAVKLSRFAEAISDDIKQQEKASEKVNDSISRLFKDFKIDIFYLNNINKDSLLAEKIFKDLEKRKLGFSIQLRPLDTLTMIKFSPENNEVRYERGIEDAQAEELVKLLNILNPNVPFITKRVSNITKNYISIFIE